MRCMHTAAAAASWQQRNQPWAAVALAAADLVGNCTCGACLLQQVLRSWFRGAPLTLVFLCLLLRLLQLLGATSAGD